MANKVEIAATYRAKQAEKLWAAPNRPGRFSLIEFARNVDRRREARGWTQSELSRQSGIHGSVISNIRLLKREPGIAIVWSLAKALGVTVDELCNGQEPKEGQDNGQR